MRLAFILVLVATGVSCGSPATGSALTDIFEGIVRNRASIDFPCPPDQLTIEDLEGYAYRATGCGDYADYECDFSYADSSESYGTTLYVCQRAAQDGPDHIDAGMP